MYVIKEKTEDFLVEEATNIESRKKGDYSLWWMTKTNITTNDAAKNIARRLGLRERFVGYAGAKDKKAVTKQLISISRIPKHRIEKLNIEGISLEFYGFSDNPISLGDLEGNRFEITLRNLDAIPDIKNKKIKNYYGEQRFSDKNADVGRAIVKRDFKNAAKSIAESEEAVREYLEANKSDYIGALRKLSLKILRIYVHSYQSYIWNKAAEKIEDDIELPIIGFDTEMEDGRIKDALDKIMQDEGIKQRDFIIKEFPELSCGGGKRRVFVTAKDFEALEKGEDELNKGKYKIKLKFFLPKGSYATEAIKQLFI
jgi:tRNA pseudouridine13 synthase